MKVWPRKQDRSVVHSGILFAQSLTNVIRLPLTTVDSLYRLCEHLVHSADLACNRVVDRTFTNFKDQSTNDIRLDLSDNLQFLALAVFRLADGRFEALKRSLI